jgi:RNase P protein component
MLRRGNKRRGKYFGVLTIPQYPNNNFHQISVQIPVKLDKRASMRNELRRVSREVFKDFQIADDAK